MSEEEYKPCKTCLDIIDTVKEKEGEKYLRLVAEFENFKKRQEKEMKKFKQFANEELLLDILPIIDSLQELYLYLHGGDVSNYETTAGVEVVLMSLSNLLKKNNVTYENPLGKEFDPNYHEAIAVFETDKHPENTVVDELRRGYKLNGRLLRPSTVRISKNKKEK